MQELKIFLGDEVASGSTPDHDLSPLQPATVAWTRGAPDLKLVIELSGWARVFLHNLADLIFFFRREPPLPLTSNPRPFWPDVFVDRTVPAGALCRSALYHVFVIVALWGWSQAWPMYASLRPPHVWADTRLTYFPVSEYLPPIDDVGSPPAKEARKGEPAYARQPIISLPRNPDNTTQTIVTPSPLKIAHDVPLPNMVAWTPVPAAIPVAAMSGAAKLTLPEAAIVAPPPDLTRVASRAPGLPSPAVVAPPPAITNTKLNAPADLLNASPVAPASDLKQLDSKAPSLPMPSVVEPPPGAANVSRTLGDINIAHFDPQVAAPRLPLAEQRAANLGQSTGGGKTPGGAPPGGGGQAGAAAAAAPPISSASMQGMGNAGAAGQLIALGIHPVALSGPIEIPQGNRRGVFAATPQGKMGAPGTPDIHGGGTNGPGGGGSSTSGGGSGKGPESSTGIFVGAGPVNPGPVAVAGTPSAAAPRSPSGSEPNALLAAARPAHVGDIARQTRPNPPEPPKIEDEVFGAKRYYSMSLNMPNLSSSGGSWIIRFAQLHEDGGKGNLMPPVATRKVDPAFPSDLMRDGLEGTVILYAVIRSDGSVTEVRVLHGIDKRLDVYARIALTKWQFRPGTKNGNAVDLEAVVQIPFRSLSFR